MLNFKALIVSLFTVLSAAGALASPQAQVSECSSLGNAFQADSCRTIKKVACSAHFSGDGVATISIEGLPELSAAIDKFYSLSFVKGGEVGRANLNFGGLNRGMIQLFVGPKKITILAADVYVNHDITGQSYTRYRCGSLKNNL